jgi:hypothetical protein
LAILNGSFPPKVFEPSRPFADVEAADGTKVPASILFPNDPKRRLEVWWSNPTARSDIHLIVIGGQSTWTAPGEAFPAHPWSAGVMTSRTSRRSHRLAAWPLSSSKMTKRSVPIGTDALIS